MFRAPFKGLPVTFLPLKEPLSGLHESSYLAKELNELVKNLPAFIREKKLRQRIDRLNKSYSNARLNIVRKNDRCLNGSLLVILMLAQGYIFEDLLNPANELPAIVSENILYLSGYAKRLPVITYSDYVLNNWRLIDKHAPIELRNIEPLFTFTGTRDEKWFIVIHVAIEAACTEALKQSQKALSRHYALSELIELHELIANSLQKATVILLRMKEQCDPDYFYNELRPYLNGWETVNKMLDEEVQAGVRFKRFDQHHHEPLRCYRGMSGAQSSILPAFDAFLNVKQEKDHMHEVLQAFQAYMPAKDREFISLMSTMVVSDEAKNNPQLIEVRKKAIDQLALFRVAHISVVHQFVYEPAKKVGIASDDIKGTGGTLTEEYLGKRTMTTMRASETLMRAKL